MAVLPQDVVTDLRRTIADLEQRLQSSLAENSRLQNELGAARDRQNASADILRTIASAPSEAERSLYQIAETSARLFAATSATIQIAEGDGWSQIIRVGESSKRVGAGVPESQLRIGGRNMPGTIVAENRQVHVPDVDNVDPAIADWPGLPYVRAAGTRSMAGAPLRLEGNAIGALIVYRDRLAPFTDEELALQQSFADQAAIAIENSRLFHETREALERQTATAEILKVIARSPSDVQPVFAAIAESAKRLLGGFSTTVLRFIGEELHLVAYTPTNPAADQALKASFPRLLAEFPTFALVRNGETVQFADIESEHVPSANRELGRLRGFRSVLFTPLMNQGMPVGMISVTRAEPGAFAAHHIQLLETFADQAVIAIENVRLFNELQQRTRDLSEALTYQTGSGNILRVIASSPTDVKPVLNAIVESACELCEADDALVALRDGEDLVFKAQHGSIPVVWDRQPIDHYGPAGRAVIDRAPVQVHDLLAPEGEQFPRAQEFARRTNVRTVLCVPLLREGEGTGVIVLRRTEVRPFSDKQITLLKTFADQAVIAIGNVRLFQQVQQRTRELAASLDELRMAQDRLVQTEKLASLGQLTAGIAHEIKNPLNFVNNFAALSAELTDELNDVLRPASLGAKAREEVDELTGMLKDNLQKVVQHGKRADSSRTCCCIRAKVRASTGCPTSTR